jgi:CRISPR-associated endonuclease/helicase Cas3
VPAYAHTHPKAPWEPLFTPFGDGPEDCQREQCVKCERMEPYHGHLNKVAWWTAKFASEMFLPGPDRDAAHQWGYLAGLWHDLGKFAPEWQTYLASKADPHTDEVSGKVDHFTAGAQHAVKCHLLGHILAYPIAGHHYGLLDAESNHACQKARLTKTDLAYLADWPNWHSTPQEILSYSIPARPAFLLNQDAYSYSLFTRLIFSCLVDADFPFGIHFQQTLNRTLQLGISDKEIRYHRAIDNNHGKKPAFTLD